MLVTIPKDLPNGLELLEIKVLQLMPDLLLPATLRSLHLEVGVLTMPLSGESTPEYSKLDILVLRKLVNLKRLSLVYPAEDQQFNLDHLSLVRLALSQQYRVLKLEQIGAWRDEKVRTKFDGLRNSRIDNDSVIVWVVSINTTQFLRHMPEVLKVNLLEMLLSER
jgi:hypothetical protein